MLVGPLLLVFLELVPSFNYEVYDNPVGHVVIVGGATLLGSLLALQVLRVAARAADGRVFLIGLGFLSVASIFAIHAIATPDVLMTGRGLAAAWSALVSLVVGGGFFALSGLNLSPSTSQFITRHARLWIALYVSFWLGYAWAVLIWIPSLTLQPLGAPVAHEHGANYGASTIGMPPAVAQVASLLPLLTFTGVLCYVVATARYVQFYRRAPSQAGLALLCGIVLLGEALITQRFAEGFSLLFWLYHGEEFIAFWVISYAVLIAYQRGQTGADLLESVFLPGTRARLRASYAQALDTLLTHLGRGEQPTPALRQTLREQFMLGESQLQVFEQAAATIAQERRQRQELEQLYAALRQLEHDRDQLTQMIVHDLRSPLTGMVGFLDLLRRGPLDDDQRELVEYARRSGRNLAGLIDDLLDIGRMEAGHIELARSDVAMRALFEECATEFSAWMQQEQKTIGIAVPDDLPLIKADARLIRRTLHNLLSNAIKHTPLGTQITLRAWATTVQPMQMVIEVSDTGAGIPTEYLDHIFEKYGRVQPEQEGRHRSTGLGLTFCRLAVEAHSGTINVSSIVGQGTTFRIVLPIWEQESGDRRHETRDTR